ncbi:O-acetyl-ADP-ribose deacetylase (regulator of RNase III) [Chitinophaga niastensis]|uniref:O-acetyl-ADP-ribose deacetylase (Regulator of RNase III) n=1 Tax=Chitinophaga niastensis TaxID=536980 RepID=A0A2P8H9D7_CHINA|nr:macro domain-containing protein [Chitinophaga niastensis]PSL42847.1 O-acetyl-ADP-ribose deacetylase (regulator of RNase III) [Chitinophaga niastensis]
MTTYIEFGDIFNLPHVKNYAHGCNCTGAMGKGIAIQFKGRFPEMYKQYKELCRNETFKIGEVFLFDYGAGYVFNLGTQLTWKTKAELKSVKSALQKMLGIAEELKIKEIALPKIGAGLGGLNWDEVKTAINEISSHFPEIDLFIVENYKPG